jgi:hypothetical protein
MLLKRFMIPRVAHCCAGSLRGPGGGAQHNNTPRRAPHGNWPCGVDGAQPVGKFGRGGRWHSRSGERGQTGLVISRS